MKRGIKITRVFACFSVILAILAIVMIVGSMQVGKTVNNMQNATNQYITENNSITMMREVSDYLTEKSQAFISTGNVKDAEAYFKEINEDMRREASLEAVSRYGKDDSIYISLSNALDSSNELAETELYAMRLAAEGNGLNPADISEMLQAVKLSPEDQQLSAQEKRQLSRQMVFDDSYNAKKDEIWDSVDNSTAELINNISEREKDYYKTSINRIILQSCLLLILLLATVLLIVILARHLIMPLKASENYINKHSNLPITGADEYRYLARAYNNMLAVTQRHHEMLSYEATHDEMTDLYNRKFFDMKREELADEETALMIVDVDHFKSINDTYGHETGDKVLQKVAGILASSFRSEDFVCRIGGDEFAVLMVQMHPELGHVIEGKIAKVNEMLRDDSDDLPAVTLSIGIAFNKTASDDTDVASSPENLFRNADEALYRVKEKGRNGYAFY